MRRTACLLLAMGLIAAADGLRCYVCNSKADSRCADPMQVAEESEDQNDGKQQQSGGGGGSGSSNGGSSGGGRYDEQQQGLQMVDCKVAHSVRQAMDAVNGLLSRLGQRAPGGGDVWAAVRASNQLTSQTGSSGSGGLLGPRGQTEQRDPRDQRDQRGHNEQESNAACHKVDMEVDGEMVTDRGCAPGRVYGQEPCDALSAALGDTEFCELCDGDGCNAASLARASLSVAAAVLMLHGLLLRHGARP